MRLSLLCWNVALGSLCFAASSLLVMPFPSPLPAEQRQQPISLKPPRVIVAADQEKAVAGDDKLVAEVKSAIDKARDYLLERQDNSGSWKDDVRPAGGTALITLALLNAGEPGDPNDPKDKEKRKKYHEAIQSALAWLRDNPSSQTYALALETMVFCFVNDQKDRKRIEANAALLLEFRMADGWSYSRPGVRNTTGVADNSNTQYALLALHEAIQRGVKVPPKVLVEIRDFFLKTQVKSGGWGYKGPNPVSTMTMTTAGLCNLLITGMDLSEGKAALRKDGSAEKCGQYKENDAVNKALEWIGDRHPASYTDQDVITTFTSSPNTSSPFYGLYGLERAGRLSGQRYFGGHDWYETACRWLVKAQKADGTWNSDFANGHDKPKAVATSFALLFLSKGRTPILISKLAYGAKDYLGWNNKRNDMKHLVEYVSRALFELPMPLAWQTFDVRTIEANTETTRRKLAAELLQSPIVFFNGHDYAPRDKEEEILREYVNNGGVIFVENCCGKEREPRFHKDFVERFVKNVFPDADLKPLELEHPLWTASGKFASSPRDFPLMGVKQGCKTVLVYSPVPLAGYWEANAHNDNDRGQRAFELAANVVAYATGLEKPRPRGARVEVAADSPKEQPKRGYLQVGQLRYQGDWQPAPRAMYNLMQEGRKAGLDVILKTQPISPTAPEVLDYRFLYLHGRGDFSEKKSDLEKLRFHLKNGGLLLADACCGDRTFDASFRKFVVDLFGDDKLKLEPIPKADALFGKEVSGEAIEFVRRRVRIDGGKGVSKQFEKLPPELEGIKYKGRWIVVYSKTDIGCALEKHASGECLAHDHDSAMRLAKAALLYSLKR